MSYKIYDINEIVNEKVGVFPAERHQRKYKKCVIYNSTSEQTDWHGGTKSLKCDNES